MSNNLIRDTIQLGRQKNRIHPSLQYQKGQIISVELLKNKETMQQQPQHQEGSTSSLSTGQDPQSSGLNSLVTQVQQGHSLGSEPVDDTTLIIKKDRYAKYRKRIEKLRKQKIKEQELEQQKQTQGDGLEVKEDNAVIGVVSSGGHSRENSVGTTNQLMPRNPEAPVAAKRASQVADPGADGSSKAVFVPSDQNKSQSKQKIRRYGIFDMLSRLLCCGINSGSDATATKGQDGSGNAVILQSAEATPSPTAPRLTTTSPSVVDATDVSSASTVPVEHTRSSTSSSTSTDSRQRKDSNQAPAPVLQSHEKHQRTSSFSKGIINSFLHPHQQPPSPEKFLLKPLSPEFTGKKCLVLDLDETLVHSSFKPVANSDFVIPVEIENTVHNVFVLKRPFVDEFLVAMGPLYEIVIFTASLSKYADPVIDQLDKTRVVHHRLFRESCFNHRGSYVKDLSQLGRDIKSVLILDNSPASYLFHPNNAVPVTSWFNDPNDTELKDLISFLTELTTVDDVVTVLDQADDDDEFELDFGVTR